MCLLQRFLFLFFSVDMAQPFKKTNSSFAVDNNDTTCNLDTNSMEVKVELTRYIILSWFRIHFKGNLNKV
jgi:hypothetical protein